MVTSQPSHATALGPQRLATRLLPASPTNVPASVATIAVVDGGRGHLLTVRAVAARLGVCRATVYDLVSRGDLAHVRVSNATRIAPADLAAYVEARRNA